MLQCNARARARVHMFDKCLPAGFDLTLIHLIYPTARARALVNDIFQLRAAETAREESDPSGDDDDDDLVLDHRSLFHRRSQPANQPAIQPSAHRFLALVFYARVRGLTCHLLDTQYKQRQPRGSLCRGKCGG